MRERALWRPTKIRYTMVVDSSPWTRNCCANLRGCFLNINSMVYNKPMSLIRGIFIRNLMFVLVQWISTNDVREGAPDG